MKIRLTVDGRPLPAEISAGESLMDVLRRLGFKSVKLESFNNATISCCQSGHPVIPPARNIFCVSSSFDLLNASTYLISHPPSNYA